MKPGITIVPEQSTTSASGAEMLGATSRNRLPVDQDVGLLEVAHSRVEAEHDAAPQQDAALPAVADEVLEIGRTSRAQVSGPPLTHNVILRPSAASGRNRGGCKSGRARSDEIASVHRTPLRVCREATFVVHRTLIVPFCARDRNRNGRRT